jgi:predicted O-methyltransferase YrrM
MNTRLAARRKFVDALGVKVQQKDDELSALFDWLGNRTFKTYVEIGVAAGGTTWLFTSFVEPGGLIIDIDPYTSNKPNIELARKIAVELKKTYEVELVVMHSNRALSRVQELLAGRTIDFLHIDGLHTYEGVKYDFEHYSPLVTRGGIIQLHDIVSVNTKNPALCGVPRYWKELKKRYSNHWEVVKPPTNTMGIGVISWE